MQSGLRLVVIPFSYCSLHIISGFKNLAKECPFGHCLPLHTDTGRLNAGFHSLKVSVFYRDKVCDFLFFFAVVAWLKIQSTSICFISSIARELLEPSLWQSFLNSSIVLHLVSECLEYKFVSFRALFSSWTFYGALLHAQLLDISDSKILVPLPSKVRSVLIQVRVLTWIDDRKFGLAHSFVVLHHYVGVKLIDPLLPWILYDFCICNANDIPCSVPSRPKPGCWWFVYTRYVVNRCVCSEFSLG